MRSLSTVEKAIDVLFAVAEEEMGVGVTEIARRLQYKKSTVHQVLVSLREKGLLEQDALTKVYRLGPRIVLLSKAYFQRLRLTRNVLPILAKLRDLSSETVVLNMRSGNAVIIVAQVESHHQVRRVAEIGASIPLYEGSAGKVVLAFLSEPERTLILRDVRRNVTSSPPNQISDFVRNLEKELLDIRKKGYAMNLAADERDAHFMSAPIFDSFDQVIGCISISGPSNRFTEPRVRKQIQPILQCANEISQTYGSSIVLPIY
ncbi:MAG: IclR family transcriptional regulator [Deltaproteobacteria bacterium]|nr:IclR family transcriptional regulator [Deltaproteobacteria bacterium]MBW2137290.1 IclR family transcriptional regulator [Deltaproteobacteria bacterium]